VRLLYANRTPADILLKPQLDALAAVHPQFKVVYTVDKPEEGWKGQVGHVTAEMLAAVLPPPTEDGKAHRVFVCGPPGMMRHVSGEKKAPTDQGDLTGLLAALKYKPAEVFKY
jgi:cytochrome-b5 reductase